MKKFVFAMVFVAASGVLPAWAQNQQGGAGNDQLQQQGQDQSQGQGQDQYQDQYQDQNQGQSQDSYNSNTNSSTGVGVGVGIGGSSGQTQSINNEVKVPKQAPHASAPSIVAAPETCMGSTSVGASSVFGGVSFGTTWKSTDCERRMYARSLLAIADATQDQRLVAAALVLLGGNEEVAAALEHVGFTGFKPVAKTVKTPVGGVIAPTTHTTDPDPQSN